MKILVCMSVVPDTTTKINFKSEGSALDTTGVQFIINPYDELSLTRALELTEKTGGEVVVIHVGTSESDNVIRKALAVGAHSAVRINTFPLDGQFVAAQIAAYVKSNSFDLIFTGRESIDYNGGAVCGLLAGLLNWPSINVCTGIDCENGLATVVRDMDGGRETVRCKLPLVVSAQKDLCEPRIPNMRGIMSARTKPLEVLEAFPVQDYSKYEQFELPAAKKAVKLIDAQNAAQLIDLLRNEARII